MRHETYHRIVVGYHGCDRRVLERVILDHEPLRPSENNWDWLGKGVYFWEFGPARALEFAREQQDRGKVETPSVLGAYIQLGRCFDLTDTSHTAMLSQAFDAWKENLTERGVELPTNEPGTASGSDDLLLRRRDCALINWYMEVLDEQHGSLKYQTVRGVFVEGEPAYDGAAIHSKTHVQLAVRDANCILGAFVPTHALEY